MSSLTLERVAEEAKALTLDEQRQLRKLLEEEEAKSLARDPSANRFAQEMKWVQEHRTEFAGQWVALDGGDLLAYGTNAQEVFAAARESGVLEPLVLKVEAADTSPFGGW